MADPDAADPLADDEEFEAAFEIITPARVAEMQRFAHAGGFDGKPCACPTCAAALDAERAARVRAENAWLRVRGASLRVPSAAEWQVRVERAEAAIARARADLTRLADDLHDEAQGHVLQTFSDLGQRRAKQDASVRVRAVLAALETETPA